MWEATFPMMASVVSVWLEVGLCLCLCLCLSFVFVFVFVFDSDDDKCGVRWGTIYQDVIINQGRTVPQLTSRASSTLTPFKLLQFGIWHVWPPGTRDGEGWIVNSKLKTQNSHTWYLSHEKCQNVKISSLVSKIVKVEATLKPQCPHTWYLSHAKCQNVKMLSLVSKNCDGNTQSTLWAKFPVKA